MLLFIKVSKEIAEQYEQFQYISCYCLSFAATSPSNLFLIFQYISCYCLSLYCPFLAIHTRISIHLMLLFIGMVHLHRAQNYQFQYISCYCLSVWCKELSCIFVISIHLMLLFIDEAEAAEDEDEEFQYISCYCLSIGEGIKYIAKDNFNTSHVTVYPHYHLRLLQSFCISIHLMLLFI